MEEKIIQAVSKEFILSEIHGLADSKLVQLKHFEAYTAKAKQIPNILRELGRLREITYREVGEGTGKALDIDEFDEYCDHIFIWDSENYKIVGAYRLLSGKKILPEKGISGFYISTLFDIDNELLPILSQALELGRSFIVQEYQKRPTPLFLLWKALLFSVLNSDARYLIGPVSISGKFSDEAKSLTMSFLRKNFFSHEVSAHIHSKNKVVYQFPENLEESHFLSEVNDDFSILDKIIRQYEDGYQTPILVRQYITLLGTKVIGFNIDPNFNNCLDALMLMDLTKAPKQTIENLVKDYHDPSAIYEKLRNFEYRA